MKTKVYYLLVVLMSLTACQSQTKETAVLVSAQEFYQQTNNTKVQLVDVRTPKEFSQGHLKNAQNIHLYDQDFKQRINTLDKNQPVYVYCKAGSRSAEAVEIMKASGFKTIVELNGGADAWIEAGKPLEQ